MIKINFPAKIEIDIEFCVKHKLNAYESILYHYLKSIGESDEMEPDFNTIDFIFSENYMDGESFMDAFISLRKKGIIIDNGGFYAFSEKL